MAISVIGLPAASLAQDNDAEVEEVVVTGSYIRNSAFAQEANVATVTQEDLFESGAPSIGQYIRDLTFTQNTDTVANVNAGQDGGQDSTGATFNLRGLGENSTLVLADGTRTINSVVATMFPDIALNRLEVVLDGGSALYGSDAVAGVVNMIPIKQFEGLKARTYYQRDEKAQMEDFSAAVLWGRSFSNGVNYVGAADVSKKGSLMTYERMRTAEVAYGYSSSGNPGVYRQVNGAEPVINGVHGGTLTGGSLVDPSCGTFGTAEENALGAKLSGPSGYPVGSTGCYWYYTPQWALQGENIEYNLYNSVTWEANDKLNFEFMMNHSYREITNRNTGTYGQNTNNRNALLVKADHPANPYGFDVVPNNYRPFTILDKENWPSHFDPITGARLQPSMYYTQRYKVQANFELAGSWTGYTYYSRQFERYNRDEKLLHIGKMQQALLGQGGPNGNEYWNPFGSADPRSPYYDEATTRNSQQLVDSLFTNIDNVTLGDDELDIFEATITGEVLQLPAGALQMATGFQMRDRSEFIGNNPLELTSQDYNVNIVDTAPANDTYYNKVVAGFVELDIPILDTVAAQLAVRHEQFKDFGLEATTPKIALRWEVTPSLAVRGSWGESFLAPTATQSRPYDPNEGCSEIFFGDDPITGGQLTGGAGCSSGNPNLQPETSTMTNIGLTWEPSGALDGLSLSLDYQTIEYTDRIRTLSNPETVGVQFTRMLQATGSSEAAYDPTPGSATRNAANAWLATQDNTGASGVIRDLRGNGSVLRVIRQANNISTVWIDLFDAKADYRFSTDNWGTFGATLSASYFTKYEYEDLFGGVKDALGYQNANSGVVPPLPDMKAQLRTNWFMGNQSASITAAYQGSVIFDDRVNNLFSKFPGADTIEAQTIVNAQYAYAFNDFFGSEVVLSGGIRNLTNRQPQRLPILGGFESRLHQPWGRQFWMSIDWTPGL
jgi:iron complex outermembrane receptor protein